MRGGLRQSAETKSKRAIGSSWRSALA